MIFSKFIAISYPDEAVRVSVTGTFVNLDIAIGWSNKVQGALDAEPH
jgi:hypothetical protein